MFTGEERLTFLALPAHVGPKPPNPSALIVKMLTALHLLDVVASRNMLSTFWLIPNMARAAHACSSYPPVPVPRLVQSTRGASLRTSRPSPKQDANIIRSRFTGFAGTGERDEQSSIPQSLGCLREALASLRVNLHIYGTLHEQRCRHTPTRTRTATQATVWRYGERTVKSFISHSTK